MKTFFPITAHPDSLYFEMSGIAERTRVKLISVLHIRAFHGPIVGQND